MTELGEELKNNAQTFLRSAELVYGNRDWTSSTILYFKAIFAALDRRILGESGKAPKDHDERFRILRDEYPDAYVILDELWTIYRATYRTTVTQQDCEKVRLYAKTIVSNWAS